MNITTLFDVGDTIYLVVPQESKSPVTCAACASTGKVTLAGVEYRCPACGGATVSSGITAPAVVSMEVTRVIAKKCNQDCQVRYEGLVGTGKRAFAEADVFATEAAALASLG